ncbi:Gfo/Idh/MocA family oxidoreductase [Candidatus Poribacteria bacterium]|jgi:predicted dehydrogenase|nr:Gfo/Idh/MocA family oxidoreductase [Candidatus Poribacteria bacterium]MBT5531986.1 Gfo/Idh/MocA family oxidoreductase [Candidatus Poribacteria bacterium]MBT5711330.1 Gfo/Idh/MocA family oxidoreductase [Candidatus Poribacteria bacterium]MBT7101786.1 Gfo/Idh/MocA family oxidoreductase [Candidatus Poribacteria bacterium]MBT7803877.1 Gfo/Idh/MocA family oxidoreductase [Candidatus Poribacteria bacterium]
MAGYGVIGVGTIGRRHIQGYAGVSGSKVEAVSDVHPGALAGAATSYQVAGSYADYNDLLADDAIVGVSICTPPFNHAEITIAAAEAGKHVLVEKPMCMTAAEARSMVAATRNAGVILGVCHARSRFRASTEAARTHVADGKLGDVYYARVASSRRRGRPGVDILTHSRWFLDSELAGGGTLFDIGCYDIDRLLYVLGSPRPVSVSAMTYRGIPHNLPADVKYDVEEHATLFVRFEGGVAATFEKASAINDVGENTMQILGSEGGIRLDPFTYFTEEDGEQVDLTPDLPRDTGENLFSDFVRACEQGAEPKTTGEDGVKVMQIMTSAYESARIGGEIRIS